VGEPLKRNVGFLRGGEQVIPDQVTNLLNAHRGNPIVSRCLEHMTMPGEIRYQNDLIPLQRVVDVYSRRASINSELNGGSVKGFDELLPSLKAAADISSVRLHSLEFLSRWFTVFTDEGSSKLLGILESPKKKAAWFDPAN
jgi:hypothetical protein